MKSKSNSLWLLGAGIIFVLFLINIFVGKISLMLDTKPFFILGDVGEFLLLLTAVTCFVIEVIRREIYKTNLQQQSADNSDNNNN